MDISSFDLNLLVAFDALLAERSVSRAASRLGLSQPAMSHALARLRDGVGDELFERTRHGIVPTPRALAMAGPVREAMDHVHRALQPGPGRAEPRRELAIAANVFAQRILLPMAVAKMSAAPLPVFLNVHPAPFAGAALTVDWAQANSDHLSRSVLLRSARAAIVRRHNRQVGRTLTLKDFIAVAQIAIGSPSGRSLDEVDAGLAKLGERRDVAIRVDDFGTAAELVAQTDFVAVVPLVLAEHLQDDLGLRVLALPIRLGAAALELSWPRRSAEDPPAMWFKGCLVAAGRLLAGRATS